MVEEQPQSPIKEHEIFKSIKDPFETFVDDYGLEELDLGDDYQNTVIQIW